MIKKYSAPGTVTEPSTHGIIIENTGIIIGTIFRYKLPVFVNRFPVLPLQTRDHRPAVKRGAYDLGDTAMRKFLVSALVLVALGLLQAEASHEENGKFTKA